MTLCNFRRSLLSVVSTAAVLFASTAPAWADDVDGKAKSLPFKADLVIAETLAAGNLNCDAIGIITGSGYATHLGKVTLSSYDCINFTSPTAFIFQMLQGMKVVLTAANGDQLFATYRGSATPQPGGVLLLSGTFSFMGGTGRFARATGTGTLDGVEDISTAPAGGVLELSAQIAY